MTCALVLGDCRKVMPEHGPFDMIVADPPYGETSLPWDQWVDGWEDVARSSLKPTGSMWVFGSMRFFMRFGTPKGWRMAQDVVWEKHNGSGLHNDRFRRVHEHVVHFYRDDASWEGVYNEVQTTPDAVARTVRRKTRPSHWGGQGEGHYVSEDGGPRIQRSVIPMRSPRSGRHRTEKPASLLEILIRTSCPEGGLVGDFFAGCSPAGEACQMTGRRYVGAEADPKHFQIAQDRLGQNLFGVAA